MTSTPYGRAALERELADLRSTENGGRNVALNRTTFALAQLVAGGELEREDARQALEAVADELRLFETDEAAKTRQTLNNAWRDGFAQPRSAPPSPNGRARAETKRWTIRDAGGEPVAVHVRIEDTDGKRFVWERPDGTSGLGGLKVRSLPLYGTEKLPEDRSVPVVVTEGEKAADALLDRDIAAVGTVTGASSCPSPEVLDVLRDRTVTVWPDNDGAGRKHGERLAAALDGVAAEVRVVDWPEAPKGADAADWTGTTDELQGLLDAAPLWEMSAPAPTDEPATAPVTTAAAPEGTEVWFARELVKVHGADLRYVQAWGWLTWNDDLGRWERDTTGEVERRAKATAGRVLAEAIDRDTAKAMVKLFKRAWLTNSIALAASEPEVVARPEDFDRHHHLLVVGNGTLDLRTGKLRPSRRADLMTRGSHVAFDPEAKAPEWDRFLRRVLPDDVREYLQRFAGSAATGLVREHTLHVLHGTGSNGKGTFTETLAHVLGDVAMTAPTGFLGRGSSDRHPTELARLAGARFVVTSETPEGGRLDENLMKTLTGGDTVTARFLHRDHFSFRPTHKLALATNNRPRISGTDEGVWRRLRLIPFTVRIEKEERDLTLGERIREREAPGVLAWIARGAQAYFRDGLTPPSAVQVATAEYRRDEDLFGQFVGDELVEDEGAFVSAVDVHERWLKWAKEQGLTDRQTVGQRTVTKRLTERGFEAVNRGKRGGRGFAGWRLATTNNSESVS